jgi:acyl-CoA synthetase
VGRLLTLLTPREAAAYYAAGTWAHDTLYARLDHWARETPDRFALRDGAERLTWSDLRDAVDGMASALAAAGIAQGDRVSVWTSNRVEAVVTFLACSRAGYVYNTSLHQSYTVAETLRALEQVGSRALVAEVGHGADGSRESIFAAAATLQSMRAVYGLPSRRRDDITVPEHALPFPQASGGAAWATPSDDPDQICYLAFTSGTTGAPKGVMHSDNSLLANARAMVRDWGLSRDTVLLSLSQMSHHIGTVALAQALVGGFELVLFDPAAWGGPLDAILDSDATYVMGVPTHAIDAVAQAKARGLTRLGAVTTFYMAGALIPGETAEALTALGALPQNVYGMTECGSHNYPLPTDDLVTVQRTCGRSCDAYEVRLFDQGNRDREVARGEIGEIGGRGAARMLGYFSNQAATEAAINAGGWFMSGDLGRFDEAGNLQIVGRLKDIIIRGGHNIHPAKIEDLAMRHAAIAKVAAVPVPDARLGERVCLVAIADAGSAPATPEAILAHLHASGLAKFDMPEYFAWTDQLPLGPTGKILKHELIAWLNAGRLAPQPVRWQPQEMNA